jgi:hypothetical protein
MCVDDVAGNIQHLPGRTSIRSCADFILSASAASSIPACVPSSNSSFVLALALGSLAPTRLQRRKLKLKEHIESGTSYLILRAESKRGQPGVDWG